MKISIISDTHFGHETCTLVQKQGDSIVMGPKYDAFLKAVGTGNDYLVMVGDVLDYSRASYEHAYQYAQVFFQQIQRDGIAHQIIYIAGNHDADIWHIVQQQRAVINRLLHGKLPVPFEHSVAGIIDDRQGSPHRGFTLSSGSAKTSELKYGGMFLDSITGTTSPTVFNFVFPSLYIVTDEESIIVTHGHYLEPYWSILGELLMKIVSDDLNVKEIDSETMVELNFPFNQLGCTGIGHTGVLASLARQIERQINDRDLAHIQKYLDRSITVIDNAANLGWVKKVIAHYAMHKMEEHILDALKNSQKSHYGTDFLSKQEVQDRFRRFYSACLLEIKALNDAMNLGMPKPRKFVFGHTHRPIAWNDPQPPTLETASKAAPQAVTLYNTGGWLEDEGKFCGAEVFIHETERGFSSVSIR
ncbi:MAG TPA: metallophosphoesterase [Nitrospirota bacterium]|nr:metallophosphoesterase [Nitrospirota bacterium]